MFQFEYRRERGVRIGEFLPASDNLYGCLSSDNLHWLTLVCIRKTVSHGVPSYV